MNEEEFRETLLQSNLIGVEDLEKAIAQTKKLKRPLERVILDMHLMERVPLYETVAKKMGVEYRKLDDLEISENILAIYPEDLARHTRSIPLSIENGVLHIAMEDPTNISLIDQVQLFQSTKSMNRAGSLKRIMSRSTAANVGLKIFIISPP